jgi:hypothetical protein
MPREIDPRGTVIALCHEEPKQRERLLFANKKSQKTLLVWACAVSAPQAQ